MVGRITQRCALRPSGRCLRQRSRWCSSRTLVEASHPSPWAEYLIADSFESSRTFESDGGGEGLLQRCALRPSGRCLRQRSLAGAQVEPWSKLLILPAWAEYLIADSFESLRTFESDGGGEGFEPSKSMTADLQSAPFGRSGTPG